MISQFSDDSACPPLSWISMYGISVALAVTWLSHSSQYILYARVIGCSLKCDRFLDPLRQNCGSMRTMVHFIHENSKHKEAEIYLAKKEKKIQKEHPGLSLKPSCRFERSVNAAPRSNTLESQTPRTVFTHAVLESNRPKTSSVTALTRSLAASFDVAGESQDFQSPSGDRWHPWVMLPAAEHTAKTWQAERAGHAVRKGRGGWTVWGGGRET